LALVSFRVHDLSSVEGQSIRGVRDVVGRLFICSVFDSLNEIVSGNYKGSAGRHARFFEFSVEIILFEGEIVEGVLQGGHFVYWSRVMRESLSF